MYIPRFNNRQLKSRPDQFCNELNKIVDYVNDPKLKDNAVTTRTIVNGAITTDKIADGAVTGAKIANGAIPAEKIDMSSIFTRIYPVGSIYATTTMSAPEQVTNAFGGTWVAWGKGRVPVGVDPSDEDFNAPEKTGGEKKHKFTVSEMPRNRHALHGWGFTLAEGGPAYRFGGSGSERPDDAMDNTGGSQSHNNLQPYITVYLWKRTG